MFVLSSEYGDYGGVCKFNEHWLIKYNQHNIICFTEISLANMDESALTSHAKGAKHQQRAMRDKGSFLGNTTNATSMSTS